mmetsp:Transcript_85397/g.190898  ORF Transcript_85397/g.190898 Transcript_85397/m.190898 type:complete len:111 (-) Transcript_85397:4-336(-)
MSREFVKSYTLAMTILASLLACLLPLRSADDLAALRCATASLDTAPWLRIRLVLDVICSASSCGALRPLLAPPLTSRDASGTRCGMLQTPPHPPGKATGKGAGVRAATPT